MLNNHVPRLALVLGVLMSVMHGLAQGQVEPLRLDGNRFIDREGEPVTLSGVNVGNWLLLEPWMLAVPTEGSGGFRDQHDILTVLAHRFGAQKAETLLDVYRLHWFTERDAANIRGFGMNVIRVPFHYSLLTSDTGPLELRSDAFQWLDRAIELASGAGLYVILDLHGAPGGQSVDMPSGRVDHNDLWTTPAHQRRTAWLWRQIAERYKDSDVVIAYDLLNEPYGDFQTDLSTELVQLMDNVIREVRAVDPDTLVFVPGQISGIDFYGDPRLHGWTNTGFTEHFYPGIFGAEERSLRRHARFIACELAVRRHQLAPLNVPYLVGEANTVFDSLGGPRLLAEYFNRYERHGWITTMWTYRLHRNDGMLPTDNWSLVTNAEPFSFDLHSMSYDELTAAFERLSDTPLQHDDVFRGRFAGRSLESRPLIPSMREADVGSGASPELPGWVVRGIAGATVGPTRLVNGAIELSGGGDDVFGRHDSFVFATPADNTGGSRSIAVDIESFEAFQQYAKTGIMIRGGDGPASPHASVHVIPSGEIRMLFRETANGPSTEQTIAVASLPVRIGIIDSTDGLTAWAADAHGELARASIPAHVMPRGGDAGLFVLSHEDPSLARVGIRRIVFGDDADVSAAAHRSSGDADGRPISHASGWNTWGSGVSLSDAALRLGPASGETGVWQDLPVGNEEWYSFRFEARAVGSDHDVQFEVRTEAPGEPTLTLASETYRTAHLAASGRWVSLEMVSPSLLDQVRLLFRADGGEHDGGLEIRNITMKPAPQVSAGTSDAGADE